MSTDREKMVNEMMTNWRKYQLETDDPTILTRRLAKIVKPYLIDSEIDDFLKTERGQGLHRSIILFFHNSKRIILGLDRVEVLPDAKELEDVDHQYLLYSYSEGVKYLEARDKIDKLTLN